MSFLIGLLGCGIALAQTEDEAPAPPAAGQFLRGHESDALDDALLMLGLQRRDMTFTRIPVRGVAIPGLIRRAIDDPLAATDELMALHESSRAGSVADWVRKAASTLDQLGRFADRPVVAALTTDASALPAGYQAPVLEMVAHLQWADREIRTALENLTPEEQRQLIEALPTHALEEDRIKLSFVRGRVISRDQMLALLTRVDLPRLVWAGRVVTDATERLTTKLKAVNEPVTGKIRMNLNGYPVVVAGRGADLHDETDVRLTIDLGGNDTYTGRHGAGVGYASVLVDLGGDDRFDVPDLSVGAALLGVGIAWIEGGDDTFSGQSLNFGAACGGVGLWLKIGGDDGVRGRAMGHGFAAWGLGLALDSGGNDQSRFGIFSQGAARTLGVGWLVDRAGHDTYRLDSLIPFAPLFPEAWASYGQGFGMGYREDTGGLAGGVGLLTDLAGDDFYLASNYSQASSYWLSVGSLMDAAGNDRYSAYHYSQSSAMHVTAAYLLELGGNDTYTVQVGASQAIGHDYGTVVLYDRAGNDVYASQDSRVGTAINNGFALFLDGAGSDTYARPAGEGRGSRGTASLALSIDAGGVDRYPLGQIDDSALTLGYWLAFVDSAGAEPAASTPPPAAFPTPGSVPLPEARVLSETYARASQWGVGGAQASTAKALDDLTAWGLPAWEWIVENRLAQADRLSLRALASLVNRLGAPAVAVLGRKALGANEAELRAILRLAVEANISDVAAILPRILREFPNLQLEAVRAAGMLRARAAVDDIQVLARSSDLFLARTAMISLAQIQDPAAFGTASSLLNSSDPLIRDAAQRLVASVPAQADPLIKTLLRDDREVGVRTALRLLALIGTPDALGQIGPYLDDPRPAIRIAALQGLARRCPPDRRAAFMALKDDPFPTVRRVARSLEPTP